MNINELKYKEDELINLKYINSMGKSPFIWLSHFLGFHARKHANFKYVFKVSNV